MLKFLLSHLHRRNDRQQPADFEMRLRWFHDPLSHPALEVMNERELADLPFRR